MARYALIIGITEYQSPQLSRLPKAATDAEIVAQLLEQYGDFQVKRLPESWTPDKKRKVGEKKVTGAELGQELETLLLKRATGSEALIYFAGHGFTVSDNLGEQQGFLATSDCQIEMRGDVAVAQKYGISLESLNKLIAKSDLSSLVMLLDCCHSGYFLERNLIQRTLTAFSAQKDYYLITACRSYEQAKSFKGEPHAIFTGAVLQGLAPENAGSNRRVTGDRLFDFISAELKNSVQEPIRMGWGRSITLVTYPYQEQTTTNVSFNRENPYLGLRAFELDQQKYFFGREQAVRALLDRLTNNRFLAVIGPSGCGKSSLVKAGLLRQLQCDCIPGSSEWDIESFTPGKHPLGTLIEILERRQRQDKLLVLFIDQFEEVFTLCDNPTERQSFVRLMAEQATACEQVTRVIATIRGDFLDRCAEYPEAVSLINHAQPTTYVVTPLFRRELEEAIEKPAALHGVKFEGGLVSQIADDVENQPGALPLLQYALSELWRVFCLQDTPSGQAILSWKDYEQIGGVKGALDKRATLLYRSLSNDNQAFVRHLFMELVQVNEGQELTRRRATWDELEAIANSPDQLQQVVGLLADQQQRLIITDENTVEVAHEALLCEWKLLSGWIEENREHLWLRRCLEADCREWQERYQQSDEALLVGARLAAIADWVEKTEIKLPPLEEEFLRKSLEKREREIQAKLEQQSQLLELAEARREESEARAKAEIKKTRAAVAAGILAVFTLGFALIAQYQGGQVRQSKLNMILTYIAQAQELSKTPNQLEALIVSIKALKILKKFDGNNSEFLKQLQSVIYRVQERNRLESHQAEVTGVSFQPKGNFIVSADAKKAIKLWNLNGQIQKIFPVSESHKQEIWNVRFSPNGQLIASTSFDKTIILWKVDGKRLHILGKASQHKQSVYDVSFSSDSQLLASSSRDGTIKIWDTKTGELKKTLSNKNFLNQQDYRVYSVDFNPADKNMIASAGYFDGNVNIWNLNNHEDIPIALNEKHKDIVLAVRFSPNGGTLASAGGDGTIRLWRVEGQNFKFLGIIEGHTKKIWGLGFSPESDIIASASEDGTIKLWKVDEVSKHWEFNRRASVEPYEALTGHFKSANRVELFSRERNSKELIIASAGDDQIVRLWQVYSEKSNNLQFQSTPDSKLEDFLLKKSCQALWNYLEINKDKNREIYKICHPFHLLLKIK